jgi:hypothetical protein
LYSIAADNGSDGKTLQKFEHEHDYEHEHEHEHEHD